MAVGELFRKAMSFRNIKIDTKNRIHEIDGVSLNRATKLVIELDGGMSPKVTIECKLSDVKLEGLAEIEKLPISGEE